MIPDIVLHLALYGGALALILYFCWTEAREDEGARYKGEDDG